MVKPKKKKDFDSLGANTPEGKTITTKFNEAVETKAAELCEREGTLTVERQCAMLCAAMMDSCVRSDLFC